MGALCVVIGKGQQGLGRSIGSGENCLEFRRKGFLDDPQFEVSGVGGAVTGPGGALSEPFGASDRSIKGADDPLAAP